MPRQPRSLLESLLGSGARALVLDRLLSAPSGHYWMRELVRHTGVGISSVQREIARLEALGLICMGRSGHGIYFELNETHPLYEPLISLVAACRAIDGPVPLADPSAALDFRTSLTPDVHTLLSQMPVRAKRPASPPRC